MQGIITIDETGRIEQIAGHGPDLSSEGVVTKRRASWVEPNSVLPRLAFNLLRLCCRDESRLAGWTRSWRCLWRVRIIGGPVLAATFRDRAAAIRYEVEWLERNRFGG